MERTYLIQRLQAPRKHVSPFSFGGGYRNGGLSDEAMGSLKGVLSFDYMGAAEFELGAVPEAFQKIAEYATNGKLELHTLEVNSSGIAYHAWDYKKAKLVVNDDHMTTIYVVCNVDDRKEILLRVHKAFTDDLPRLKERTNASQAVLEQISEVKYPSGTLGWLELDNGFFFSIDKDMSDGFCKLFGVGEAPTK